MPSPAQIEGRALLESLLPAGRALPDVNIRARRDAGGEHIAFHFSPAREHGRGGEWMETIVLPRVEGRHRDAALARIAHQIGRNVEIQCMVEDMLDEARGMTKGEARTTPAWRFHCPLALRRAMDRVSMPDDERLRLAETKGRFQLGGYDIRINDRSDEAFAYGYRGIGHRTVTRITITGPGVKFSQGTNKCYLQTAGILPTLMRTALPGLPVSMLIDVPGLDAAATVVERCSTHATRDSSTYDLSRTFGLLADPPSLRTKT